MGISGFTAKVAGTERGVTEPQPTFSACFGAAFLPLHPNVYGELLEQKLEEHGTTAYLVNTGWSGGPAVNFDGSERARFDIPKTLEGIDSGVLNPYEAWEDKEAFDAASRKLAGMFVENFSKYSEGNEDLLQYGPVLREHEHALELPIDGPQANVGSAAHIANLAPAFG